jgi:alkylated DNA repair protein alkB family protein 7
MADDAYGWEEAHFDGVISRYREMLVREGAWGGEGEKGEMRELLSKVYSLLPPPSDSPPAASAAVSTSPPSHLIMHLLHLSSRGAIYPHVDNLEAFGRTIAGVSLGGERVMRFKQVSEPGEGMVKDGPVEFEVLVEPGSAYIQSFVLFLPPLPLLYRLLGGKDGAQPDPSVTSQRTPPNALHARSP